MKWNYICPICNQNIIEDYEVEEVKDYIGATHNCPKCNGLLKIEQDLSCSDFGKELAQTYSEYYGRDVSIEEASKSYIEI